MKPTIRVPKKKDLKLQSWAASPYPALSFLGQLPPQKKVKTAKHLPVSPIEPLKHIVLEQASAASAGRNPKNSYSELPLTGNELSVFPAYRLPQNSCRHNDATTNAESVDIFLNRSDRNVPVVADLLLTNGKLRRSTKSEDAKMFAELICTEDLSFPKDEMMSPYHPRIFVSGPHFHQLQTDR